MENTDRLWEKHMIFATVTKTYILLAPNIQDKVVSNFAQNHNFYEVALYLDVKEATLSNRGRQLFSHRRLLVGIIVLQVHKSYIMHAITHKALRTKHSLVTRKRSNLSNNAP